MEFSKKYLLKYGWEEGQGLGKDQDGMKNALKPKLKFNKDGLGYDPSHEFTDHWWDKVYNDALQNKPTQPHDKIRYIPESEGNVKVKVKTDKLGKKDKREEDKALLDSDQLYIACGGRTAHKGARHGLRLSGKLRRLEQQELALLQCSKDAVTDTPLQVKGTTMSVPKKIKKKKRSVPDEESHSGMETCIDAEANQGHKKKKKRKKNNDKSS